MININKPGKVRVLFDAGADNLVVVLPCFRMGRYAVMGDIEQIFHQILVENKDRDALRFLWRDNYIDPIEDHRMNVHLFGKDVSPCIENWTIKKAATDQSDSIDQISIYTIENDFYMYDLLSSFQGGFPIDRIYFKQLFNTSSFTNK